MSFGDFMGLVVAMAGLLGIVGILGTSYNRRLAHKERLAELRSAAPSQPGQGHAELIERLEHRIRVLERIATDKSTGLASEIEGLRAIEERVS